MFNPFENFSGSYEEYQLRLSQARDRMNRRRREWAKMPRAERRRDLRKRAAIFGKEAARTWVALMKLPTSLIDPDDPHNIVDWRNGVPNWQLFNFDGRAFQ